MRALGPRTIRAMTYTKEFDDMVSDCLRGGFKSRSHVHPAVESQVMVKDSYQVDLAVWFPGIGLHHLWMHSSKTTFLLSSLPILLAACFPSSPRSCFCPTSLPPSARCTSVPRLGRGTAQLSAGCRCRAPPGIGLWWRRLRQHLHSPCPGIQHLHHAQGEAVNDCFPS